ncbi:MAG TPA: hypothetical protein VMR45_04720 [Patescibacteria group bacterium]|jgi:hypothetical protein|nr:hypothetical protein [Patescibacteria group bacterium]
MKPLLGLLAFALNAIGYMPYIRDIFRKVVKPHPTTWGIWSILTIIAAVNQVKNQGGWSSLFMVSSAVLVMIVFLLSLRYGMGGASKLDKTCLILALLLLVYWLTLRETRISTLLAVIIDAIGVIPTVVKTYKHPETETYPQWVLAGTGGFLTIFSVPRLDWVLLIYPIYVFLMNTTVVTTKYVRER